MAPQAADADAKRARIVDAALDVCDRCGVGGARMEEVAALARVSKGTLYRFFESKEDLFLATIIDAYERHLPLFDARVATLSDPRERLEALLDGMTEIHEQVAPRMTVHYQAWGLVAGDPGFQKRLYDFLRGFHAARTETLEETIREGQRRGVFRADVDPGIAADGIQSILGGFLYRASFDPENAQPARLRRTFDILVRNALAAPEGDPHG